MTCDDGVDDGVCSTETPSGVTVVCSQHCNPTEVRAPMVLPPSVSWPSRHGRLCVRLVLLMTTTCTHEDIVV